MEDFNNNKNVAEKEEGELSSDDDDNQPKNIPESVHSVQTVKEYKKRQVNQSSAGCKGNTSDPIRIAPGDDNRRECKNSPQGLKRHYSAPHYENQPLSKYRKQASPGQNEVDPDDVMNGYYSSGERRPDDLRYMIDRKASESENHHSFEKTSKLVKRRNTVSSDLRHRLSEHRSAAQKPSSSRTSHTRSWVKSSSGKEFYLSKYNKLWDQRKPSDKQEYIYRNLQIQVSDRGRKEVERKVKERPFGQPMEKRHRSNHSSQLEGRSTERQREVLLSSHHSVTSPHVYGNEDYSNYSPQDLNYHPTPSSPNRTLAFGRNPIPPINQNSGYGTFPPHSHANPDQYSPVSLPTTSLQRRPQDRSVSDFIDQKLHSIRSGESMQFYYENATISGNIHYNNSTSAFNGPHVKPEDMASNYSSSIKLQFESGISTSIFNSKRLGPEVKNDLSDIQPGLGIKNQREYFSETAENICNRNTSNRNQFSNFTLAHNTTIKCANTTTPRPVSGSESNRNLNENLTKTKAERKKEELKKYMSTLGEVLHIRRMREQVFKERKNDSNSLKPCDPITVLHTQFKIDKTPKVKPQSRFKIDRTSKVKPESEFRTSRWTTEPIVSERDVNSCNDTLEQKEQINPLDSGLPQINDETTVDVNLASSLSESQNKVTEPQEKSIPNEANRRHVYLSPLNMFETYRNKQASTKGITATHDKSHVMSLVEIWEKEACNKQASALEITETHDEGHVMSSAADSNKQASAKEVTETHDEDHVMSSAADLHGACTTQAKEITDSHEEDNVMSSAADGNKQDSAKENTETHNKNVMSSVETQEGETCNKQASSLEINGTHDAMSSTETQEKEACNNQDFAMEISEIYKDYVMGSTGDGNKQASAKEITKTHNEINLTTHNENNLTRVAEAWETCNKQASTLESTESHEMSFSADLHGDCTTKAKEITESHPEGHVMSSAADLHGACTIQAKEITESHEEDNVMSSAADGNKQASAKENTETHNENVMSSVETQEGESCNKQASSLEISGTHDVVSSTETQEKEACNNQDFAMEIGEIYKDHVMGSTGDGNRQASAKEITKTHNENNVISPAEAWEICNKQASAKEITKTHNENNVTSPAEAWETCNKQASALESTEMHEMSSAADLHGTCTTQDKEITGSHDEGHVMSSAADLHRACTTQAKEITGSHDEGHVMSSAADLHGACTTQAKEITGSHDEGHVMSSAADLHGACTTKAKEITASHDEGHVRSSAADLHRTCTTQAKKITESHDEGNVMSSTADLHGACTTQAKEITESHDEGNVISSAADVNKKASAKENTETHDEGCVMSPVETHDEEACNSQALESTKIHDKKPVVSSTAETQEVCDKQDSAMESTETHENHAMGPAEAHREDRVMSSAADTQEEHHKEDSAMEITETHDESDVVSCAETQEACDEHVSAIEISKTQNNAICSAADGGNKLDVGKEISETHYESHVINLEEKEEDACNK